MPPDSLQHRFRVRRGDRPYTEADSPSPRSSYGLSKLLGEWFALEGPRAHVLRVESLFGHVAQQRGSLDAILSNVLEGREVPVFVDRTVSPSYTVDVAKATRALVDRVVKPIAVDLSAPEQLQSRVA